jgi:hypothetical protein
MNFRVISFIVYQFFVTILHIISSFGSHREILVRTKEAQDERIQRKNSITSNHMFNAELV